jgi:hypothetical protein
MAKIRAVSVRATGLNLSISDVRRHVHPVANGTAGGPDKRESGSGHRRIVLQPADERFVLGMDGDTM